MTTVTIIIPAYNAEKHIASSIQSVIQQSYQSWELIIINDGSTDKSEQIIKQYVNKDNRIYLINQENNGVSAARNKGLSLAKGKYISFLDADDTYSPLYIESMLAPLLHGSKISFCKYKKVSEEGEILIQTPEEIKYLFQNSFISHINSVPNAYADMAFMYDINLLLSYNHHFYIGATNGEDTEFLLKASYFAENKISFVPEYLYIYLNHLGSATNQKISFPTIISQISAFYRFKYFIENKENSHQKEYLDFTYKKISIAQKEFIHLCWKNLKKREFMYVSKQVKLYEHVSKKDFHWSNNTLSLKEKFKKSIIRFTSFISYIFR